MSQATYSPDLRPGTRNACLSQPARWVRNGTALLALAVSIPAQAIDFGPDGMFSINGFGEATATVGNNQCPPEGCQLSPETDRQKIWADAVVPGRKLSTEVTGFTQFQLWFGAKYDLGGGFKLKGTLSQNWRDGSIDTPGFVRERNVALSHEEYGTFTVGETVSRTWQFADFPFGSNLGLSSAWAGTGAGYRNLTRAIRYTSRVFDVADGDMVLEMTYDRGSDDFKINKPRLFELWTHYGKGDLSVDAMYQDSRNGSPSAFGAAGFYAPFYDPAADSRLGGSGQSVALLQAIYQYSPKIELSGALRRNKWSGAYAVVALDGPPSQWNFPFNVDWGGTLNGVANPGYPARSTDFALGARYRMDKWILSTGMVYIGKASTNNPSERGQSNSAIVNTIGATYNYGNGWEASAFAGMIHYRNKGLAPLGMPSNATINAVDSRVTKAGNWFGVGIKYNF
jgi:predicted porin